MSETPIEPREHYVYALYREDGVTPFYIGVGKGYRWQAHDNVAKADRSPKARIIRKVQRLTGKRVPKAKLYEGLTRVEALAIEVRLIAEIGRIPDGPLANATAGGEGVTDHPKNSREKQREANRRAWANPEKRATRIAAMRAAKAAWTPEQRENFRIANAARQQAIRDRLSAIATERWARIDRPPPKIYVPHPHTEQTRAAQEAGRQRAVLKAATPEVNEKRKASLRTYWAKNREEILRRRRETISKKHFRTTT